MKKFIVFICLSVLAVFNSSFTKDTSNASLENNFPSQIYTVPTEIEVHYKTFRIPFVGNSFNGFREALAFKESQGKYHVINTFGYIGKYQFGASTLERFRIYDTEHFLNNPVLQEDAFIALCSLNKWILRKDIKRSVGKKINGITITESGILAAAHLAGAGNVKHFLRSNGKDVFRDAFGSSIQHYLKEFAGYDTSFIEASKKPIV
jgi:hypothetical protein